MPFLHRIREDRSCRRWANDPCPSKVRLTISSDMRHTPDVNVQVSFKHRRGNRRTWRQVGTEAGAKL
jgi:hypothetical protein